MSNYLSDIYMTDNHYYNYTLYRCYGILLRSNTYVRNTSFIICFSKRVIEFFSLQCWKVGIHLLRELLWLWWSVRWEFSACAHDNVRRISFFNSITKYCTAEIFAGQKFCPTHLPLHYRNNLWNKFSPMW